MNKKILVTGKSLVTDSAISFLKNKGYEIVRREQDYWSPDELHEALNGVDAYIIGGYEEPQAEHFVDAKKLTVVAWPGTDFKPYVPGWRTAYDLGIAFICTPGINTNSVAEFTITLILVLNRRIGLRFDTLDSKEPFAGEGYELFGKKLGIIGLGKIGSRVAEIAKNGFHMEVNYFSKTRKFAIEETLGITWMPRNQLISQSDIVSLHRPGLGEGEAPEIGQDDLVKMKKDSILINTVKYDLVDLKSLYEALSSGNLGGAAFDGEGRGENWGKLTQLSKDKFVWFPQTAFNTRDANERASLDAVKSVADVLEGRPSKLVSNPDFLTKRK
jgi:phosphoglycerate dehydrogenase-like enzyme